MKTIFTAVLAFIGLVAASPTAKPIGLEKREGSVPNLVGNPSTIDSDAGANYIRVSRMNDGSLIAGYTTHDNGEFVLLASKSTDNGQTWSHLGEVFRGLDSEHMVDNAFPLQIPSGRVLFAYRNHDLNPDGSLKFCRISISYSDDGGVTYKYLSTVDQRVYQGVNGLWEPFLRIANDGTTIQAYYSEENDAGDQDGWMRYSHDDGMTWSDFVAVSGGDTLSRDGMIGVAPVDNNGNLIAVFENTEDGYFTVDAVLSPDDGYTWGNRFRLYTPRQGNGCDGHQITAGAPQVYNVWGTLVASFMTNEDHDTCHGYDGGDMKVIISTDGGKTWGPSVITGPSAAHWPGLFNVDPTHFLALYSRDGEGAVSQLVELS